MDYTLFASLGVIKVPEDYCHETALSKFRDANPRTPKLYMFDENITDANFSNPSHIMKPGERFRVGCHGPIKVQDSSSEERMTYLASLESTNVGAQGAALVLQQKATELTWGLMFFSFDEKERLWKNDEGNHGLPGIHAHTSPSTGFGFFLGKFESPHDYACLMLSFELL